MRSPENVICKILDGSLNKCHFSMHLYFWWFMIHAWFITSSQITFLVSLSLRAKLPQSLQSIPCPASVVSYCNAWSAVNDSSCVRWCLSWMRYRPLSSVCVQDQFTFCSWHDPPSTSLLLHCVIKNKPFTNHFLLWLTSLPKVWLLFVCFRN